MKNLIRTTGSSWLVSISPLRSSSRLPPAVIETIPPTMKPCYSILGRAPATNAPRTVLEAENRELRKQLMRAKVVQKTEQAINEGVQAQLILRDAHLDRLNQQLNQKENEKETSGKRNVMAQKKARWMTHPDFREYKRAQEGEVAAKKAKAEAAKVKRALTQEKKAWRSKETVERHKKQAAALGKWEKEKEKCQRTHKRLPPKPKIRKLFPRAPTPDRFKTGIPGGPDDEEPEENTEDDSDADSDVDSNSQVPSD
jgi:hypothetical protein